ncbi:hypothetical protein ES705_26428 [subsurface metagenome]
MPIDYGWLATKMSGSFGPSRIQYHRKEGKTVWRMKPPHKRKLELDSSEANPCRQWKQADAIWVAQSENWRQMWREALKKPGMSGYDLWMKEALTLCSQGNNLPDVPSISGGWSTAKVIPGDTWPAAGKEPVIDYPLLPESWDCYMCFDGHRNSYSVKLDQYVDNCQFKNFCEPTELPCYASLCRWHPSPSVWKPWLEFVYGYAEVEIGGLGLPSGSFLRFHGSSPAECLSPETLHFDREGPNPCSHGGHADFTCTVTPL